jgi:hypothetical protein
MTEKTQDRSGLVQRLMGFGARPAVPPPGAKKRDRKASLPEYRQGRKSYTTWFDEECVRQIKRLAAEQGVKQQDLAVEAYNLLFAKYHKPEIAT